MACTKSLVAALLLNPNGADAHKVAVMNWWKLPSPAKYVKNGEAGMGLIDFWV